MHALCCYNYNKFVYFGLTFFAEYCQLKKFLMHARNKCIWVGQPPVVTFVYI